MEFIKREMYFVLITEYMDESLVLLKRKWCWDMEDILYLPAKVRTVIWCWLCVRVIVESFLIINTSNS